MRDIPLPEKYRDLGPKSGEILLTLQAEAFNEMRERLFLQSNDMLNEKKR